MHWRANRGRGFHGCLGRVLGALGLGGLLGSLCPRREQFCDLGCCRRQVHGLLLRRRRGLRWGGTQRRWRWGHHTRWWGRRWQQRWRWWRREGICRRGRLSELACSWQWWQRWWWWGGCWQRLLCRPGLHGASSLERRLDRRESLLPCVVLDLLQPTLTSGPRRSRRRGCTVLHADRAEAPHGHDAAAARAPACIPRPVRCVPVRIVRFVGALHRACRGARARRCHHLRTFRVRTREFLLGALDLLAEHVELQLESPSALW
mmetsp:Transcript_11308/g.47228  ORF Transcript_11308/g.47228 Transcript_11308/m.47228 type:complete len:261 (+) Transcript_11308:581-1363(+)